MKTFPKTLLLVAILLTNSTLLFAVDRETSKTVIENGIGLGSALAIAICWTRTNSILSAIVAGIFGWLYVLYFLSIREKK